MKEESQNKFFKKAIESCLEKGIPFCSYIEPGERKEQVFYANPSRERMGDKDCNFFIGPWLCGNDEIVKIYKELDASATLNAMNDLLSKCEMPPLRNTTPKDKYVSQILRIKDVIDKGTVEKVVISRIKSVEAGNGYRGWTDVAERLFRNNIFTFRFIFYTPETGAWMGASPEVLLEADRETGSFRTMALAGTRSSLHYETTDDWGGKDKAEHNYVVVYINDILTDNKLKFHKSEPVTFQTGDLQHIKTEFEGTLGECEVDAKFADLLYQLNPTPALCGFPQKEALKIIKETENHERRCYGGFIGVSDRTKIAAYVNLRNINFDDKSGCLYGGGGIVRDSVPDEEWNEAESKMNVIENLILEASKKNK